MIFKRLLKLSKKSRFRTETIEKAAPSWAAFFVSDIFMPENYGIPDLIRATFP